MNSLKNRAVTKPRVLGGIGEKRSNNNTQWFQQDRIYDDNVSIAVTTDRNPWYKLSKRRRKMIKGGKQLKETIKNVKDMHETQMLDLYNRNPVEIGYCQTVDKGYHNSMRLLENYKIRKLTPKECFRLMGVKDEDYEKIAKNQSDSSLYHLAGDSIVVDVLQAIIKEMI